MQLPFDPRLAPTASPFQLANPDPFAGDNQLFGMGNAIKFDSSTNDPTPENSEDGDSKFDDEFPGQGVQAFRRVFSFEKDRVFSGILQRDLPLLGCNQVSYHRSKTIVAFNQKSVISLLIMDDDKHETFLQKAVRSKAGLFSSCSFFDHPSPSLLALASHKGPVKVFDTDAQKGIFSLELNASLVQAFGTSLAGIESETGRLEVFDIRNGLRVAAVTPLIPGRPSQTFSISRTGNLIVTSSRDGVFCTDLRKTGFTWDVKSEVTLRSPIGSPFSNCQPSQLSFKKHRGESASVVKCAVLSPGRLLIVDLTMSTVSLVDLPSFRVVAFLSPSDPIIDFAVSQVHELVTLLCTSSSMAGFRKLVTLDFSLQLICETCLDNSRHAMLGFCGEEDCLLINDTEAFSLFKRSSI